jgi:SAM-dependent methyltransferase
MSRQGDLAGKEYWDQSWQIPMPGLLDINDGSLANEMNLRLHELLMQVVGPTGGQGRQLLEVGCARSVWLPYFARQLRLQTAGLDYSEIGCEQARALLTAAGAKADVHCADMFAPPDTLMGRFDFVFTLGVMEHFRDTAGALSALGKFLKPGGTVITVIPNMKGSVGALQQLADRAVFETHVPLTDAQLRAAHEAAGFDVGRCEYFVSTNYYVVNAGPRRSGWRYRLARLCGGLLGRVSMGVWMLERRFGRWPAVRAFSPYVICVARRK